MEIFIVVCDIMIYMKYIFGHSDDQNVFLIYIFSPSSQFLAHNSPKAWNFLSIRAMGASFIIIFGPLSSVPEIVPEPSR